MITWMQKHRKYLVPTIWISTFAFIGAGFVGWGAYDYGNNKSDTVARVGNQDISVNELQGTYSNLFSYYNQMFGGKLTQEKAAELHLEEIALDKLTNEALLLNYADELGITALKSEVLHEYTSIKAFQENGIFNKAQYEKVLRAQGINQKTFEQGLEKNIKLNKLREVLQLPLTPLESEASFAGAYLKDHLFIKTITQDPRSISLSDAQLKEAWEKNKNNYMSPTTYLLETIKVVAADLPVDETKLSEFYQEKKYLFKDADGKILPFEKAKTQVATALQFKTAKTAILKKYLAFKKGEIPADRELTIDETSLDFPVQTLKESKEGAYLKAIKLHDGYLTAKIKKITPPQPLSFQDAKEQVSQNLRQEIAQAQLMDKAKAASVDFKDGKDIGFLSKHDADKMKDYNPQDASQFLRYVFSKNDKNGYFITGNDAIVYHIAEQKLYDQASYDKDKNTTEQNIANMKNNVLENGLIKTLKEKYKIESFMKKEG